MGLVDEDQAAGLRRLMGAAPVRHVAVLEPGRDSGAVALALARALAAHGAPTLVAREGRTRAYRHAPDGAASACRLPDDAFDDLPRAVRAACLDRLDMVLASAQAETWWKTAPRAVRAAQQVMMIVHAHQDPVEALAWVYASVKALRARPAAARTTSIVVRGADDAAQRLAVYRRVADLAAQSLGMRPAYAGGLPQPALADAAEYVALARGLLA